MDITNLSEAKQYYWAMGCSLFHMMREDTKRYEQYCSLGISKETELEWKKERFEQFYSDMLTGKITGKYWALHSEMEGFAAAIKKPDIYQKVLAVTRFIAPKEANGQKVIIAETINGRRDNKFRDGLLYGAYDCGLVNEAKEFAKIAFWLADNDREPKPNKNNWSPGRVGSARQKTQSILDDLNLRL